MAEILRFERAAEKQLTKQQVTGHWINLLNNTLNFMGCMVKTDKPSEAQAGSLSSCIMFTDLITESYLVPLLREGECENVDDLEKIRGHMNVMSRAAENDPNLIDLFWAARPVIEECQGACESLVKEFEDEIDHLYE